VQRGYISLLVAFEMLSNENDYANVVDDDPWILTLVYPTLRK